MAFSYFIKETNMVLYIYILNIFISVIFECRIVYHAWEYLLNREIPIVVCDSHGFSHQQSVLKSVAKTLFNKIKPYSHIHCFWFITIIFDLEYPSLDMLFHALWFRVPFYSMLQYFRKEKAPVPNTAINQRVCSYGNPCKVTQP